MDLEKIKDQQSKRYKIINELEKENYFGEISLITNLPITASVHTVDLTICGVLSKEAFSEFLSNFQAAQREIMRKIYSYDDIYFNTLHSIIMSIKWFRDIDSLTVRKISLKMKRGIIYEGKTLIQFREMSTQIIFILSGEINLFVYDTEKKVKYLF